MNILNIAYYTAIRYFRKIWMIAAFIITSVLFVYVMGAIYDNMTSGLSTKENVGFYTSDTDEIAVQFEKLFHSEGVSKSLTLTNISSREDGITKLKSREIDAFIYIAQDFSSKLKTGGKFEIIVYHTKKFSAVKTLIDSFVNSVNGSAAMVKIGGTSSDADVSNNMTIIKIITEGRAPSPKDMLSIACILIVIFYGALLGSNNLISDLRRNTYIRSKCAPIRSIEDFCGKLLGNIAVMYICAIISMLAAKYAFKVNLGGNILILLLILLLFLIITNSFGVLLAGLFKNIYLCGLTTFAVNFFMVYPIMASAFAPGGSTSFDISRMVSPHYYVYQAVIGSTFPGMGDVPGSIAILIISALVLSGISWEVGRRVMK